MATVTPNFNWPVPTSTDLVKDGATAIEALGDSIDASLVDLKGGTTGQVLSKTSATDMDFTWVTSDDANAIQNTIVDAKGDLIAATAADTPARLAVGANNRVLMADSSTATGLKYGGEWVSYTPTFTGFTLGNGTLSASYSRIGDNVFVRAAIGLGSTSSVTGAMTISNPVTNSSADYTFIGTAALWAFGTSGQLIMGTIWETATGSSTIFAQNSSATYLGVTDLSATAPFTWATGNFMRFQFSYRAA